MELLGWCRHGFGLQKKDLNIHIIWQSGETVVERQRLPVLSGYWHYCGVTSANGNRLIYIFGYVDNLAVLGETNYI